MTSRILLVDDDELSLLTFAALLEDAGYRVTSADSCADARARLAAGDVFEMVVADRHLGDGAGEDLLREARRDRPGVRCAILSGDPAPARIDFDAWLLKGDAPEQLIARLTRLLAPPGSKA
jgi:DNA-binding NtrC family response regulator